MAGVVAYPTGTLTFLFTDVEGSTRLWATDEEASLVRGHLPHHGRTYAHTPSAGVLRLRCYPSPARASLDWPPMGQGTEPSIAVRVVPGCPGPDWNPAVTNR